MPRVITKSSAPLNKENVDDIYEFAQAAPLDGSSKMDLNEGSSKQRQGGFFNIFKPTEQSSSSSSSSGTGGAFGRSFEQHQQTVVGHVSYRNNMNSAMNVNEKNRDPSLIRLPNVPDKMRSGGPNGTLTDRERVETEIIKTLLSSYFDIVKKNFLDLVPKTIMHFLVNAFKESLQNELVKELYKEEMMLDLMKETPDVASRRKACREMKELLRRGLEIVNEVRDFTFM